MTDAERAILHDLLAYADESFAYPDVRIFRVRHEHARTTIDDLLDAGLIRPADYVSGARLVPTPLGLNALDDELACAVLDHALIALEWLQRQYRENPTAEVEVVQLAPALDGDHWYVERALRVLEALPGWRASSPRRDGRLNTITLTESVLDITPDALRQRPRVDDTASPRGSAASSPLLTSVTLTNFLSFGERCEVPLGRLNVLVGANGSGKSNLLAAISLLRLAPTTEGLKRELNVGGGPAAWLWASARDSATKPYVSPGYAADLIIEARIEVPADGTTLRFKLGLASLDTELTLVERIEAVTSTGTERLVFGHEGGSLILDSRGVRRHVAQRDLHVWQSRSSFSTVL